MDASGKVMPQCSGLVFWLIWVVATCAGVIAMSPLRPAISQLQSYDAFFGWLAYLVWPGTLLLSGAAQHFALRFLFPGETRWFGRTLVGALLGIPAGLFVALVGLLLAGVFLGGFHAVNTVLADLGLMLGTTVSVAGMQAPVLQRYRRRVGWWIVATSVAWMAGMLAAAFLAYPGAGLRFALDQIVLWEGVTRIGQRMAADVTMGLLAGGSTGAALLYMYTLRAGPPTVAGDPEPSPPATLWEKGAAQRYWPRLEAVAGVLAVMMVAYIGYRAWHTIRDRAAEERARQQLARAALAAGPVFVPAGEFIMGEPGISIYATQHTVYLDAYWIDRVEVTNGMYAQCVTAGVCEAPPTNPRARRTSYFGNPIYANYPVRDISWNDAQAYCQWVGARLPTEAEWEKAARGTDGRQYPWGNQEPDCSLVNYNLHHCVEDTTPVGSYPTGASPYGALDMAGNVWEWVADWYDEKYYANSPLRNPMGPATGEHHVIRGGDYGGEASWILAARRERGYGAGFRCARSE